MRAYARIWGDDEERYAVTGLVHDLDYERFPDAETGHPRMGMAELERRGYPAEVIDAVAGHAEYLGVPRESRLARTLFAVDELSGFVMACALIRPTGIEGMKVKSVRKKLKQPSFAAKVDREQIARGIDELGSRGGGAHRDRDRGARRPRRGARADRGRGRARSGSRNEARAENRAARDRGADRARDRQRGRPRQPDQARRGDRRRRQDRAGLLGRPPGVRLPGDGARPRGRADRPAALLRLLLAVVEPDPAGAQREPPGDQDRPDRPRRLREAAERLRDRLPGRRGRRGPELARGPGRNRRRPLARGHGRHRAGDDGQRARRPHRPDRHAVGARRVLACRSPRRSFTYR